MFKDFSLTRFVDCGAYIGDTLTGFEKSGYNYDMYFAIEPEPSNFRILSEKYGKTNNVFLMNKAVSDCTGTLDFAGEYGGGGLGSQSYYGAKSAIKVSVDTIDNLFFDTYFSFLKLEINGEELKALKGAAWCLDTYRPVVSCAIYHNDEDMISIPMYIMGLRDYKIYIRQYGNKKIGPIRTQLYGVPAERRITL